MPENEIVVRLPFVDCLKCSGVRSLLESEGGGGGLLNPEFFGIWVMCFIIDDDLCRLTARCEGESLINPGTVIVYTTSAVDTHCGK